MSLIEKIDADIKKAMLAKDKERLEPLRAVKSALLLQRTEKGTSGTIDDETEIKILQRLVKQRKEAAEIYTREGREDLAGAELSQAAVIETYLPAQMSEPEIRDILKKIIEETGASGPKDMGKVMGRASKEFAGKADNKIVSGIVKELLG
jgi:uncharacterized protein